MKLWTGDEWRALSDNEALYRIDCGYIVREDDDPCTAVCAPPVEAPAAPAPETPKASAPKKGSR